MRLFVAVNLPAEVRERSWEAVAPLRDAAGRDVAWVRAENLHVTLRFLGDRPDAFARALDASLRANAEGATAPTLRIESVGAFPGLRRPRVLWLGIAPNSALAELYQSVERACAALGEPLEERPFHPHVTIGRVRPRVRIDADALTAAVERVSFAADVRVPTVDLMQSHLGPGGSRYEVVSAVSLVSQG